MKKLDIISKLDFIDNPLDPLLDFQGLDLLFDSPEDNSELETKPGIFKVLSQEEDTELDDYQRE